MLQEAQERLVAVPVRVQSGEPRTNAGLTRGNTLVGPAFHSILHPSCILRMPRHDPAADVRCRSSDTDQASGGRTPEPANGLDRGVVGD